MVTSTFPEVFQRVAIFYFQLETTTTWHPQIPSLQRISFMSTTNELRLGLLPIITSYRQKKWITAAEECTFLKMISTSQFQSLGNNNSSDSLEVRVEKVKARLDEIEVANRVPENESLEDNQTYTAPSVTEGKGYTSSSTPLLNRHTRFPMTEYRKAIKNRREISSSNSKDDLEIENNYEYKSQVNVTSADIFDLAKDTSIMLKMSQFRHSEIEELFVGMISFAKLGFIQPPCCIRCAYASDKSGIDEMCENLVLWRKNANILIQPSCLKENSIILKVSSKVFFCFNVFSQKSKFFLRHYR